MYDSEFETEELNMNFSFKGIVNETISITCNEEHLRILTETYSEKKLSPSAINTYLDCKLRFYFKYIAKVKEKEEIKEEIDGALFGNIFHYVLEQIYFPYENKLLNSEILQSIIANTSYIQKLIHEAIAIYYYRVDDKKAASKVKIQGQGILIASQMLEYVIQVLRNDIKLLPFKILGLEKDFSAEYEVFVNDRNIRIRIGGIVDRLDQTAEGLRVVDYKTGRSLKIDFNDWDMLFDRDYKERRKEILQALIYADVISQTVNSESIYPVIYRMDELFNDEFTSHITFNKQVLQYHEFSKEFSSEFSVILSEIFSLENIYDQTKNVEKCRYCSYNKICRRETN
jgi:CRISPR/Cas system-associated exonuclease Cas4 (RecB family)